jgi:pilus assembly protein Flp/PilA
MKRQAKNFLIANNAATAIEYGLIAAMVALAVIAGGYAVGSNIQTAFNKVTDNLATGSIKKGGKVSESGYGLGSGSQSDGN